MSKMIYAVATSSMLCFESLDIEEIEIDSVSHVFKDQHIYACESKSHIYNMISSYGLSIRDTYVISSYDIGTITVLVLY